MSSIYFFPQQSISLVISIAVYTAIHMPAFIAGRQWWIVGANYISTMNKMEVVATILEKQYCENDTVKMCSVNII